MNMNRPESNHPPDEKWWERELFRDQKVTEQYIGSLGENLQETEGEELAEELSLWEDEPLDELLEQEIAELEAAAMEDAASLSTDFGNSEEEEVEEATEQDEHDYKCVAGMARDFAVTAFQLEDFPMESDVFMLSAGKIGANLAGGHGLGYSEESICGNIVKCKWALADCEFCRELLEHVVFRKGHPEFQGLLGQCMELSQAIRERIGRLRQRVWW